MVWELAPELIVLALAIVAYALITMGSLIVRALFGAADSLVGWIPWLGSRVQGPIHGIEQRLNSYLQRALVSVQNVMGTSLHVTANAVKWTMDTMIDMARATGQIVWLIDVKFPLSVLSALAHEAHVAAHEFVTVNKTFVRYLHTTTVEIANPTAGKLGAAISTALRPVKADLRAFEAWTRRHIGLLVMAGAIAVPWGIPGIQRREKAFENELASLRRRVRSLERLGAGALGVAAVAYALKKLGLNWIRCDPVKKVGRKLCGGFGGLIDALFGLGFDFLLVTDICAIARLVTAAGEEIRPILHGLVVVEDAALCGGQHQKPTDLPLYGVELAKPTRAIPL